MEQSSQENESDELYVPLEIKSFGLGVFSISFRDHFSYVDYITELNTDELGAYARALERLPRIKVAMERLLLDQPTKEQIP